jgi:hypothetical protein
MNMVNRFIEKWFTIFWGCSRFVFVKRVTSNQFGFEKTRTGNESTGSSVPISGMTARTVTDKVFSARESKESRLSSARLSARNDAV